MSNTVRSQKNGAVSKVSKKSISHLTRVKHIHSQQRQLSKFRLHYQQFASRAYVLTTGPRGQFPRWRRSRKRLSVCSILRCPDLWLQCNVSFVHVSELLVAHALPEILNCAQNSRCTVITDLDTSKRSTQKAFSCFDTILETGPTAPQ
jgi:hypothetical protein